MKDLNLLNKLIITSFCDGMSTAQYVFNKLFGSRIDLIYNAYELALKPILLTLHHFPKTNQLGDIRNWRRNGVENAEGCHVLIAGTSCKRTSKAGKGDGFCTLEDIPRKVKNLETYIIYDALGIKMNESCICFFESIWYMRVVKPKFFFFEIPPLAKEWYDVFVKEIGVEGIMIDASLVSAQVRKRWFFTNIPINGQPKDLNILLSDMIPGATGYGTHSILNRKWNKNISDPSVQKWLGIKEGINKEGKAYTLPCGGGQYILPDGSIHSYDRNHLEWLTGFPIGHTDVEGITLTDVRSMMGNGWSVPVTEFIFQGLEEFIQSLILVESH